MSKRIQVGVLGATGAVGQRFCQLLEAHPWFEVGAVTASERSAGKYYKDAVDWRLSTPLPENIGDLRVIPTKSEDMPGDVKLVFSSPPLVLPGPVEAYYALACFGVSSNAASYSMCDDVPLLFPEVYKYHVKLLQ